MKRIKVTVTDEVYEFFDVARKISGIPISKLVADVLQAHVRNAGGIEGATGRIAKLLNELKNL